MTDSWIQLGGVEQILPPDAWELEILRRKILDRLFQNGYDLVVPPIADFVESLLGGTSEDLDLLTVKAPDYASGKLFGIRADMTPQIARIAAHHMPVKEAVVRLCYLGSSLLARPRHQGESRELLQYGAEIFGSASPQADGEAVRLMVECLQLSGAQQLSVSVGHIGVIAALLESLDLNGDTHQRREILAALQQYSKPRLTEMAAESKLSPAALKLLCNVIDCNGSAAAVDEILSKLTGVSDVLDALLTQFSQFIAQLAQDVEHVDFQLDMAQVGGFQYHTGIVFSAYGAGCGYALANGGRYDHVLSGYGQPCPATGFSGDLRLLRRLLGGKDRKGVLLAADAKLPTAEIGRLLEDNDRVIRQLPGQSESAMGFACDRKFINRDGCWAVVPFGQE